MLGVRCFERDQDLRDLVDGMLLATAVSSFGRVQGLVVDHGGLAEAPEGQVALALVGYQRPRWLDTTVSKRMASAGRAEVMEKDYPPTESWEEIKLPTAPVDRIMEPAATTSQRGLKNDRSLRHGRSAQGLSDVVSRARGNVFQR